MSDETPTPRPGSAASLDRRVERLEAQQDQLQASVNALATSVELVKVEQGHMKELMGAKFTTLETALGSMSAKFEQMVASLQQAMADPNATPAGRQGYEALKRVHERIDEVEHGKEETHEEILKRLTDVESLAKSNREWIVRAGGIVAAVLFIITFFGAQIRAIIFPGS